MEPIRFLDDDGTFTLNDPEAVSCLYFPLASEAGLKSAITPGLGGDCKLDQETFLLEPVSSENLHASRSTRNFWCVTEEGCWSAAGASAQQEADRFTEKQDECALTVGLMWQTVCRESKQLGLQAEITSFVPPQDNVEIMEVQLTNTGTVPRNVTGIAAIPIYGRSADNIRDHRNVTSMLHRLQTTEHGVLVKPTMSFDEKGHRENHNIYYVLGSTGAGEKPVAFYPTVDSFLGEGGTLLKPRAVYEGAEGVPAGTEIAGREAMGGIRFPAVTLEPGQSTEYIVLLGVSEDEAEIDRVLSSFHTVEQVRAALSVTRAHWQEQVNVRYHTGDPNFDRWMRWVSFQPFLRRIYGCSFLPHHDYGRGGRGWRDLWQDCLSLLLMDPQNVGDMIRKNFGGVRVDGTNATIIGAGDGNFIADRNGIARVWMDHALWPLMTTKLYIDQTGDLNILNSPAPYFKDPQALRGTGIDQDWNDAYGNRQRTESGEVYQGTILEHLLIQHLTAFYEVGEHNIFRLRGADWNDALDMAAEHGESVAFTCAYAGNLRDLAGLLRRLTKEGDTVSLLEEIQELLAGGPAIYPDIPAKTAILERYTRRCIHNVSGRTIRVSLRELADNLEIKANWLMEHIRRQEWISDGENGWFNSYYDNHGRQVEGVQPDGSVRMMLTGQVFAIMSGTATDTQVEAVARSADRYLYKKEAGGYRLNTDFHELKFDMGRMFGFAYGEKENGAVFSHMTVMYANALYRRGFVREGYRALQSLADTALDFQTSRIFPGIPEYFNADGRGMYHYLTGAASWYMLTVITQVFGVHGEGGDLVIEPKLVREQFDGNGEAAIDLSFAGKQFHVVIANPEGKDFGVYRAPRTVLSREEINSLPESGNTIRVELT
ncbi:GH36-type glycosyl hydrolase domain-containing protein [uncultured Oscillibacter sp.]|uniref:GH36-type glycosyl hydrolase domain-containing protein n=1 Tax=uncultured Oscillibacter sp. TaxID=876091 RepID=UPI002608A166|nr:cellobiose phosphorylase [uncultured Oscillibacter sp.]